MEWSRLVTFGAWGAGLICLSAGAPGSGVGAAELMPSSTAVDEPLPPPSTSSGATQQRPAVASRARTVPFLTFVPHRRYLALKRRALTHTRAQPVQVFGGRPPEAAGVTPQAPRT
jgi:hypothetical protein